MIEEYRSKDSERRSKGSFPLCSQFKNSGK